MKILCSGENFRFAFCICICILHFAFCILHFAFCIRYFAFCILHFAFEFPAKNSEFFRFKYLNFPPTFLDSIGGGGGAGGGAGHGDNRGTSCIAALNQYPLGTIKNTITGDYAVDLWDAVIVSDFN